MTDDGTCGVACSYCSSDWRCPYTKFKCIVGEHTHCCPECASKLTLVDAWYGGSGLIGDGQLEARLIRELPDGKAELLITDEKFLEESLEAPFIVIARPWSNRVRYDDYMWRPRT